jgi:hypothetical protein
MDNAARMQAFLTRLWELQDKAGLTDTALAREMGVNYSHVWRAKNDPYRPGGAKFILGACSRFPELSFVLSGDIPVRTVECADHPDEAAS